MKYDGYSSFGSAKRRTSIRLDAIMWFYFLLIVLLNLGLGYGAGKYYLQRRVTISTKVANTLIDTEDFKDTSESESQMTEPEPVTESEPPAEPEPSPDSEPEAKSEPDSAATDDAGEQSFAPRDGESTESSAEQPPVPEVENLEDRDDIRLIAAFEQELQSYHEELLAFKLQAEGHRTACDSKAVCHAVRSAQRAIEIHTKRQADLLIELREKADASATVRIEQAINQERSVIEAVNIALDRSPADTDAEQGNQQLLDQVASLLEACDKFNACLDEPRCKLESQEVTS